MRLAGSWFTSFSQAKAPVELRGAPSPNYWTNREPQTPGNIHQSEVSRRSSSQHQDPALPNSLQTPVLEASGQTTSKTGTQSHPTTTTTKRQKKNMSQMKEQGKNLQDQINEEEIGNLPEKESRVMIVKMIQNLGNRMESQIEKIQEMFNKDLEELKNKQTEMNNTITEMKNTLEGINNRITEAEERISELEDRMVETTAEEQDKEKRLKRIEDNPRDLWENTKCTNIQIIGVPEKNKGSEKIFEEIMEKFPNMGKEIVTQVQEAQRVPYRINPRRNTPRHILIKLSKIKFNKKILKEARVKQQITYKGIPIRLSADFSAETLQARRAWQDILKVMKEKNEQSRLLYPARISFRFNGEIKSFSDKQKLREFSTTKPALQQMLEELV